MDIIKYSPSGEYLAVGGSDGHLRIWETVTNKLWHEYIPSSHLAATCTCIEWAPTYQESVKGYKKKKRRLVEGDVVVMGTVVGSLLFYNITKSQPLTQSNKITPGNVNALAWSPLTLSVYTCGADGIIREWEPENATVLSQWSASKESLTAMATVNSYLLVGGQTITLWDLNSKKSISTFTGHPGRICQLEFVPNSEYFVSMAQDRHLKIWQTSHDYAIATLAVPESATNFHVFATSNGTAVVAVTNRKGHLHIFRQKLNGQIKKPLTPTSTVKIMDLSEESFVPVLAGHLTDMLNVSVAVAYGSSVHLRFEKLEISSMPKEHTLIREFARSLSTSKSKKGSIKSTNNSLVPSGSKINLVEVPSDVKHLQPGTGSLHHVPVNKVGKGKYGSKGVEEGDLPMEERLTNLTIDAPVRSDLPQGENLGHLLSQGLHSKDSRILQSVLHRHDERIILNTIRSFPVQLVIPLIEEIKVMLSGKSQLNHSILKWLKAIFQIHSSYLMCCSANEELMGPILSLLRARETLYPQMCLLKGKLDLVKSHIAAKQYKADLPNDALLTYQDESSDDEGKIEDGLLPSESEDLLTSDDLDPNGDISGSEDNEESDGDDGDSGNKNYGSPDDDDVDGPRLNGKSHGNDESDGESIDED